MSLLDGLPGLATQESQIPEFTGKKSQEGSINPNDYSVKYLQACISDLEQVTMLQDIETRGIRPGSGIVILGRDKFMFNNDYFIVLTYLQKNGS